MVAEWTRVRVVLVSGGGGGGLSGRVVVVLVSFIEDLLKQVGVGVDVGC